MYESGNIKICLEAIRKVTKELTATLDVAEVLQHIARLTAEATGVKGCAVRVLNEKTRRFELSTDWGLSQKYLSKGPIDADHSLAACMKGEIVHILDTANDPRIQYPEEAKAEGIVSMLSVPMMMSDRVVGVLRLYTSQPRSFSEEELMFVRTIADLGILALQHARLYSGLKVSHDSLIEDFHNWFEAGVYKPQ